MPGRVPYLNLNETERAALHAWFDEHGVHHHRVPINPKIKVDGSRVSVLVHSLNAEGKKFLAGDTVATEWVTFEAKSPMPWRSGGES